MRLGIDIDGCLANFTKAHVAALIEHSGEGNKFPPDCTSDPNWPTVWNYHYEAGYSKDACNKVWKEVVEGKGFWESLEPLPGAEQAILGLNRLQKSGHDIYFLTHRSGKLAKQQTENWLESVGGFVNPTVLLTGDKLPVIRSLGIEFFVDDKIETVNDIHRALNPAEISVIKPIFLKDAPYNRAGRTPGLQVASSVEDALRQAGLWQDAKRGRPRLAA